MPTCCIQTTSNDPSSKGQIERIADMQRDGVIQAGTLS